MKTVILVVALILTLLVFIFGYKGVAKTAQTGCLAQLNSFEKNFLGDVESLYTQSGSVIEKKYGVPCGVEKIYFVDITKEVSFSSLGDFPEMVDSIHSGVQKNVFLIKGGKVYDSFYGGDIDVENPYFDCYDTKAGTLNLYLKGKDSSAGILKKDSRFDCTFSEPLPVELTPEDLGDFLEEIGGGVKTDDCEIERSITEEGGSTKITIIKFGGKCRYFENIPKCAIESLVEAINSGEIELGGAEIFSEDPIIMWDFDPGRVEEIYTFLNKLIDESCKREFLGAAVEAPTNSLSDTERSGLETFFSDMDFSSDPGDGITARNYAYRLEEDLKKLAAASLSDSEKQTILTQAEKRLYGLEKILEGYSGGGDIINHYDTEFGSFT